MTEPVATDTASAATTVDALVIPADPTQPMRRLQIETLADVQTRVGGLLEGFPCFSDPSIWGYAGALSAQLAGEPNARASSILNRNATSIAGDVVLLAFDDVHQLRDLPLLEDLLAGKGALPHPDLTAHSATGAIHAWELADDGEGSRTLTVLTITHQAGLSQPVSLTDEYIAILAGRREKPDLFGGSVSCAGPHMALCIGRELGVPACRHNTLRFTERALATVRALYALGDERVTAHFHRTERAAPARTAFADA